jgi:hypothetical protein
MEQFRPSIKRADGLSAAELEKDTHFNIEAMKFLLSVSDSLTSPNPTIRSIAAEMENKIQTFERGDHDVEIPRSMLDALTEGLASGAGDIAEATKGRFGTLLGQTFNTRQFAATERGLMSLVPLGTKKGDEVVLFLGGKTPFILREWEGGLVRLVGEAYVHGFMDGAGMIRLEENVKWFEVA